MITVVGEYAVLSLLECGADRIETLFIVEETIKERQEKVYAAAYEKGVTVKFVDKKSFEKITQAANHQGVAATCVPKDPGQLFDLKATIMASPCPLILFLDEIQDPHNLGACLRTAEVFGVTAVVWPKHGAVKLNETVYKIASGAVERLALIEVTNLVQAIELVKAEGVWVAGLAGEATTAISDYDFSVSSALVMGNEHKGLRTLVRKKCDVLLSIPQLGQVESLNVSVATGVALYEAIRQRKESAK